MGNQVRSVPRPLVRTNQWFIVVSVLFTWITKQEWILAIPILAGLMGLFFGILITIVVALIIGIFTQKPQPEQSI